MPIKTIRTHSVTESKTHCLGDRVYTTATSFCHMTLARVDNTSCGKTGEFSLDLSEMGPVNVITSINCHLKRPLRYGGYLCNQNATEQL